MLISLVEQRQSSAEASPTPSRVRLDYLDGIRALAALYVSFFHATLSAAWTGIYGQLPPLPTVMVHMVGILLYGHFAVSVFIILSGYCLMLPVTKTRDLCVAGGIRAFLWRRARRILPPYYAALCLALLVALLPGMNQPGNTRWAQALPAWELGAISSHLLLIQNWRSEWLFKINMPAWSVAPEWQIYWLFPLVLLPLSRRCGVVLTVTLALSAAFGTRFVFGGQYDFISYSYVGLFTLGMLGATINFAKSEWTEIILRWVPWGTLAGLSWLGFIVLGCWRGPYWMETRGWLVDVLVGFATMCLLVYCTRTLTHPPGGAPQGILRLFCFKPLVLLGGFSYSYYLLHDLVINGLHQGLVPLNLGRPTLWCVLLGLGVPLSLAAAYAFHLLFERPFMPLQPATATQAARAAAISPAP